MCVAPHARDSAISRALTRPRQLDASPLGGGWLPALSSPEVPQRHSGETHVHVTVTRNAGTDREKVERHTAVLRREGEMVEVTKVRP